MLILIFVISISAKIYAELKTCQPSPTTMSGFKSQKNLCSGQLIFEDNFDIFNDSIWQPRVTLSGGRISEFQWYVNNRDNIYTENGTLHLKPRLTSDYFGEAFLTSGQVVIPATKCTNTEYNGCDRQGSPDYPINPVRSARIRTINSFSFKYGTLEVRAKMPAGDWLWPAIWLLPTKYVYGLWPRSGEIDLVETRGNRKLFASNKNVGTEQIGSTLHFGPQTDINGWKTAHYEKNRVSGYDADFHVYKMFWTPDRIQFFIDDKLYGTVNAGNGFWQRGNFTTSGLPNLWANGTNMTPFDEEFHIVMNIAVGGNGYFSDSFKNGGYAKPWRNTSPYSIRDFWEGRDKWLPTWNYNQTDDSHLQVDYVRVWAL